MSQGIEDVRCAIIAAYISGVTAHHSFDACESDGITVEDVSFLEFWNLYDKKRAKPECEKLWSKLSKAERKKAMEYIPLYKKAQPDKQFRQDPSRFLRRKTWEDEIIQSNGNGTTRQSDANKQESDFLAAEIKRLAAIHGIG